ncbi:MAG: diguanylate cyclase, partial [Dokdonella sp.]
MSVELAASMGSALPDLLARHDMAVALKNAADGSYLGLNDAMAGWLGRPAAQCIGRTDADLLDAPVALALRTADQAALAQPEPLASDHVLEWRGTRRECNAWRQRLGAGTKAPLLLVVWSDAAPMRQKEAQLRAALDQLEREQRASEALRREVQDHSMRDSATGLNNRAHFEDQLRREVDLSTREHREFALVSIELDPLAPEVLARGDDARARVVEALGRLLRGNTRAMDGSCRYDETRFAVLLSGVGLATAHS